MTLALLMLRSGARCTVVERSTSLDREYRGEILQPGGLALLDQLGVLAGARARGCCEHDRFQLVDRGKTLLDIDYRALPEPYNVLLSLPQQHLLEELIEQCRRYEGFELLDGHRASTLLQDGTRIAGVRTNRAVEVVASVVVGADGRYSKTRLLAGIENQRFDMFDLDVLWFKLPAAGRTVHNGQIFHAGGSPVLVYRSYPDTIQVGWTLPHKGYAAIAARGIDAVKAEIARAAPPYADLVAAHIHRLSDLSLLDVFAATAREWVRDGLVLIGDAAHTHSPLGAQGLNLAIQDATVLHPVLVSALQTGDFSAASLHRYVAARKPDVDAVTKLQAMQSRGLLSQSRLAAFLRPKVARVFPYTPLPRRILGRIAFGNKDIAVRTDLFAAADRGRLVGAIEEA
jgi:monooxygenase